MWLFGIVFSNRLDAARAKNILTTTSARKLATAIGTFNFRLGVPEINYWRLITASLVPALCLVGVCLAGCDRTWAVALMTLGITAIAGMFSGFLANHIDIAPKYAGEF
jgi:MFS transporter, ACS family, solute carrier family 17 (sodium-dependent inorganic phosphate cotransporter), other